MESELLMSLRTLGRAQEVRVKAEPINQAEPGAMEDTQAGGAADMDTSEGAAANAADGDLAESQQPPTPACKPGAPVVFFSSVLSSVLCT